MVAMVDGCLGVPAAPHACGYRVRVAAGFCKNREVYTGCPKSVQSEVRLRLDGSLLRI
jgi:hypothetical protein